MMQFDIGPHVSEEALERYLMRRLTETEIAAVEEHLLVCSDCQFHAEQADEFMRLAKAALPQVMNELPVAHSRRPFALGYAWSGAVVCAAAMMALAITVVHPDHHSPTAAQSVEVRLYAMRGSDTVMVHTRSGATLVLDLDMAGLPVPDQYLVRVVNSAGAEVWTGPSERIQNPLRVTIGKGLAPGRYWIRLTSRNVLVREYGLNVD